MQIEAFKIRASAVSQIMTNPRSKSEILSQTCKSYLQTWLKEQLYQTKKTIQSKYLVKGTEVEDIAIDYYSEFKGLGFVLKNQDYFENDYMKGTPDLLPDLDTVYEFKSSWDCFTFPLFETDIDKSYWMQTQVYMHLTSRKKAVLVYTLQNTPDELEWDESADYSHLPASLRIKEFEIQYDIDFINSVEERVKECRLYIEELLNQIK
jgi:hypothetical protein